MVDHFAECFALNVFTRRSRVVERSQFSPADVVVFPVVRQCAATIADSRYISRWKMFSRGGGGSCARGRRECGPDCRSVTAKVSHRHKSSLTYDRAHDRWAHCTTSFNSLRIKHFHRLVWVSFIVDPNRVRSSTELSIKQFRAFDRRAAFFKRSAHEKHFSTLTAVPGSVFDKNHRVSSVGLSNTHIRRTVLSLFVSCASRKCSRSVGCIIRFNNNIHENSFQNVGYGETRREGVMRKRVIRSEVLVRKALTG